MERGPCAYKILMFWACRAQKPPRTGWRRRLSDAVTLRLAKA